MAQLENMNGLNNKQVVEWLREKGNALLRAAAAIEAISGDQSTAAAGLIVKTSEVGATRREVTLDAITKRLDRKNCRIKEMAAYFGAPIDEIKKVLEQPDCPILIGERGWLKFRNGKHQPDIFKT